MLLELCWIALSLALGAVAAPTEKGVTVQSKKNVSLSAKPEMRAEDANTDKDRMSFLESYADSNVILE